MMRLSALMQLMLVVGMLISVTARPNVVIFLADDLGYGDLSSYGGVGVHTKHIDKLAAEGARFSQFYATSLCTPSRAALLTGRLPVRNQMYTNMPYPAEVLFSVFWPWSVGGLPQTEVTIAKALKAAGYSTGMVGKWHLGAAPPTRHGFDFWLGTPYSHDEGCVRNPPPAPGTDLWNTTDRTHGCASGTRELASPVPLFMQDQVVEQPVELETLTRKYTQHAVKFMEHNRERPFLLYVAYNEVHHPSFSSDEFARKSPRGPWADMLHTMDASVGTVMDALRRNGLDNNTLVVFTSDNGPSPGHYGVDAGSAAGLRGGKSETWEGGVRVPAILRWPGKIAPGQLSLEMTGLVDVLPTVLEAAGAALPTDRVLDGRSLLPLVLGSAASSNSNGKQQQASGHQQQASGQGESAGAAEPSSPQREAREPLHATWFHYHNAALAAVRVGPHKAHFETREVENNLIKKVHSPPLLFNVDEDPFERRPLTPSNFRQHALVLASVEAAVAAHRATLPKPFPPGVLNSMQMPAMPCARWCWRLAPATSGRCVCPVLRGSAGFSAEADAEAMEGWSDAHTPIEDLFGPSA